MTVHVMERAFTILAGVTLLFGICVPSSAGEMEPPGPPAPTMVTLQEIYDKLDDCTGGGLCGIQKTGQTDCSDAAGSPIDCAGTGQDGEYQKGASVDPRFTDNGDGTVTDNLTSLIWLQNSNCFGNRDWSSALLDANLLATGSCGLTDGSVAGDWRLPNVRELQSLIDFSEYNPALPAGHPFPGAQSLSYWSSTSHAYEASYAWYVYNFYGYVDSAAKTRTDRYVWPVRGGE
jgi:hypothetical protein